MPLPRLRHIAGEGPHSPGGGAVPWHAILRYDWSNSHQYALATTSAIVGALLVR